MATVAEQQREALFDAFYSRLCKTLPTDAAEAATLLLDVLQSLELDEKVVLFAWLGALDTRSIP